LQFWFWFLFELNSQVPLRVHIPIHLGVLASIGK
jgi:hypothetical protein